MAVVIEKVIKQVKLLDVKPGDVFEWLEEVGSRKKGELAIVKDASNGANLEFYPFATHGNYGSVQWLEELLNTGAVILRQTSKY